MEPPQAMKPAIVVQAKIGGDPSKPNLSHKFLSEQLTSLMNTASQENQSSKNPRRVELHFPPTLTSDHRKRIHILAQQFGLHTDSVGVGADRFLRVIVPPKLGSDSKDSSETPQKPAQKKGRVPKKTTGLSEIIDDFLYLGGGKDARDHRMLQSMGITHVLNVASEWQVSQHSSLEQLHIKLMDYESEDIAPHFQQGFDFIEKARRTNQRILVHCVMGKSRSVTFVLAYLMQYRDMYLRTAFDLVYSRRNVIKPNRGFIQTLIGYEKQLYPKLEKPTVEVEELVGIVGEHGYAGRNKIKVVKTVITYHTPQPSSSSDQPNRQKIVADLFEQHFPEGPARDALSQLPLKSSSIARAIQIGRSLLDNDTELLGKLKLQRIGTKEIYKLSDDKVKAIFQELLQSIA